MKKFLRITGTALIVACGTVGAFGLCAFDCIPTEYLDEFIMLLIGNAGGMAAGAYIRHMGGSM